MEAECVRDEQIIAIVDGIHADNLGGDHRSGFCKACADAYLVVMRVMPSSRGAVEEVEEVIRLLESASRQQLPDKALSARIALRMLADKLASDDQEGRP
jgi:hypothetical protein